MKQSEHVKSFFWKNGHLDNEDNRRVVTEVNRVIDQFADFPNPRTLMKHRKFLHHWEGIEYFRNAHGLLAAQAAEQHVLEDCGHIPHMSDYHDGTVDSLGYIK